MIKWAEELYFRVRSNFIRIVLVILICCLLIISLYLVSIAPYHIYTLTLTEGVNTEFLKMQPTKKSFYDGEMVQYLSDKNFSDIGSYVFKRMHFGNFEISLPIVHPSVSLIPNIKIESQRLKLGASFVDDNYREFFTFMLESELKFEVNQVNQKLFLLPVFRNFITRKTGDEILKDIFLKKLSLPSNEGKSFFESLKMLSSYTYQDLVYHLFILNNRTAMFPPQVEKIQYDFDLNIGVVKLESKNDELLEKIYIFHQGFIYPITLRTSLRTSFGKLIRDKFIKEIKYKISTKDSAVPIYAEYRGLDFKQRIDGIGMIYLYTAWTHDLSNKEFVRVIIQFLERGKSNIKYLRPFYEYAYKYFGSSFSTDSEFLIESPEEKLKRKSGEELRNEIQAEENSKGKLLNSNIENKDLEETIKNNLQKAKDKKINSDDLRPELQID